MLDPGVHHYYTAGLTLGVLLWEADRRPELLPWLTVVTAVLLEVTPTTLQPSPLAGGVRLTLTAVLVAAAFLATQRRPAPTPPVFRQRSVVRAQDDRHEQLIFH